MDTEEMAEVAIQKEAELSSEELAIRQANKVDGLEVTDEGEVEKAEGDKDEIIDQLISKFEEMMGDVAANLIAQEMKSNDVDADEVPDELSERY